ncbi:MAG: AsmA family protein [Alphaproteobacteria bacterium]
MIKKAVWFTLGIVIFLFGLLLLLPAFVDLGVFKSSYLPLVEDTLHRRIDVGEVRLSLLPRPSIRLSNLKVSDSPTFSASTFFSAEQLQLRLKLWPLLRGRFEVTEFILDKPVVNLLKEPGGTFNYSDLAAKGAPSATRNEHKKKPAAVRPQEAAAIPLLVPTRMRIRDGRLNLETNGQKPVQINGIELTLRELSGTKPLFYRAAFNYPGLKSVSLEGELSYHEDQASVTLTNNHLKVHDLILPVDGSVSNLATVPRFNLTLAKDPVEAAAVFQILSVFGLAPRNTDISGPMSLHMTVTGPSNNAVTQILGIFKDVKVAGKRAAKGNLNGRIFLKLPFGGGAVSRRLQGEGNLVANDGELTNVDLIRKIQRVTGMIGLTKEEGREATTFKTLEADFTVADGSANFKRVYLINPQMEVQGAGTMTLNQPQLNMAVETTLSAEASARANRGRAATFFKNSEGRIVVPLRITGAVRNPSVNLDTDKLAERGVTPSLGKNLGTFLNQFFRR